MTSHIKPLLMKAYERIELQFQQRDIIADVMTGFGDLDALTFGLRRGELIVVAGATGVGKSTFGLNVAHHVGLRQRLPIVIFSSEMSEAHLTERLICIEAHIPTGDMRRGCIEDGDWHRITNAVNNLYQASIYLPQSHQLTLARIAAELKSIRQEEGDLGLIVVDYLQLLVADEGADETDMVRALKELAREFDVALLLVSQLEFHDLENPRPDLSDLPARTAQDADIVLLMWHEKPLASAGETEIIVAKQRNGPTGVARLNFAPQYARFTNAVE